jgi:hypothetical protein
MFQEPALASEQERGLAPNSAMSFPSDRKGHRLALILARTFREQEQALGLEPGLKL